MVDLGFTQSKKNIAMMNFFEALNNASNEFEAAYRRLVIAADSFLLFDFYNLVAEELRIGIFSRNLFIGD